MIPTAPLRTPTFEPLEARTGLALKLAMQRLWLTGRILPAGARLIVQHVFRSQENATVEVVYSFPLPRDAALRSFRITGEVFEAHSELKPTEEAVKAYEDGIARGALSTLARQYGDGVVNLTVGNIRPGETVVVHLEKRKQSRVAARLAELSRAYGLASREMSLVAVVTRPGDRPGDLPATRVVPVGMPQDTNFGAYFGPATPLRANLVSALFVGPPAPPAPPAHPAKPEIVAASRILGSVFAGARPPRATATTYQLPPTPPSAADKLLDLAAQLEPDGGMSGATLSERAARTAAAVLAFAAQGHTATSGPFRSHVARLVAFLKSIRGLPAHEQCIVERAIEAARKGAIPAAVQ